MKTKSFKRISLTAICFILSMCMMITIFAGCGNSSEDVNSTPVNESEVDDASSEITDVSEDTGTDDDSPIKNPTDTSSTTQPSDTSSSVNPSTSTPTSKFNPYAGIESEQGKTVKLFTWWKLTNAEEQVLKQFKKKYGINYKVTYVTKQLYASQLTSMVASGKDIPDLAKDMFDKI